MLVFQSKSMTKLVKDGSMIAVAVRTLNRKSSKLHGVAIGVLDVPRGCSDHAVKRNTTGFRVERNSYVAALALALRKLTESDICEVLPGIEVPV